MKITLNDVLNLNTSLEGKVTSGPVITSGLTQSSGTLLERSTAGVGAVEELTLGSGLSLSGGVLSASASGGAVAIEEDGIEVIPAASRLNFTGTGVTLTDSGSGEVQIDITGSSNMVYPYAPRLANFTQRNITGASTVADIDRGIVISSPRQTTNNLRMLTVPILPTPWVLTTKISVSAIRRDFMCAGVVIGNVALDDWRVIRNFSGNATFGYSWGFGTHFGVTDQANNQVLGVVSLTDIDSFWQRVTDNGTDRICEISPDGVYWHEVVREASSAFVGDVVGVVFSNRVFTNPANVGLDGLGHMIVEYFEYCDAADVTAITANQLQQALPPVTTSNFRSLTGTTEVLVLSDANGVVEMNQSSPNTLQIPLNSSVAIPIGASVSIVQAGTGATTIDAVTGVLLNGIDAGQATITGQWGAVTIYKRAANEWAIAQGPHGGVS